MATQLGLSQSRIVPEYSFLDARYDLSLPLRNQNLIQLAKYIQVTLLQKSACKSLSEIHVTCIFL